MLRSRSLSFTRNRGFYTSHKNAHGASDEADVGQALVHCDGSNISAICWIASVIDDMQRNLIPLVFLKRKLQTHMSDTLIANASALAHSTCCPLTQATHCGTWCFVDSRPSTVCYLLVEFQINGMVGAQLHVLVFSTVATRDAHALGTGIE
jgi:hypothetical protein